MILVHHFLRDSARRTPEKRALICGDRAWTFAQLDRESDHVARMLQRAGVRRGDRVALMLDSGAALVTALFGALKAGAVFVILNPTMKAQKLAFVLEDCAARALIGDASLARNIVPAVVETPALQAIFWVGELVHDDPRSRSLAAELQTIHEGPEDPDLIDEDLCAIIYTSGSTGNPKGVMLTHRNMTNTAWSISTYLENVPEDIVLCVLPLSFDYGLYQVITGTRVGFTVVLERSFAYPYRTLQQIEAHRVTGFPGVPTIFATLIQMAPFKDLDLSSLRYFTNTGAAFPPAHIRRLQELFPAARIYSMYGLTECTRVSYLDPKHLAGRIDSVGKAMPNSEVYIIDGQGRRVPPGEVGELVIRGANVMRGYWNRPEETARYLRDGEILGEKVLHVGDLFRMDEEGFLYFVSRKDDIFKCKGEKISPKEIENVLYELEDVAAAAVIGVEDPIDGQAILALVVPRDGGTLSEQQVRNHCRARLENYMVPKFVEIRDALPKTASGKIQRKELQ